MPLASATELAIAHRAEQGVIANRTAADVLGVWQGVDLSDVDGSWSVASRSIAQTVERGHAQSAQLAANFMTEHARLYGVTIDAVLSGRLDVKQLATALRVTGPIALKIAAGRGMSMTDAGRAAAVQLVGSSSRLVLLGGRDTTNRTVSDAEQIVGYRRVGRGNSCAFCSMLISRGAAYKSELSAGIVGGHVRPGKPGRTRGTQQAGSSFHDHCRCQVEPLYDGDAEPLDIEEHRRRYLGLDNPPTTPAPPAVLPIAERDLTSIGDDDLSDLLATAESDLDVDAVVAELDRRDAAAHEARKDAERKARRKDARDKKRDADEAVRAAEYDRRLDDGDDPESAYADVYGVSVERLRRTESIASLRANGYRGRNFDELSADAFRDHVEEVKLDAEAATRGTLLNGTRGVNETRDLRKLFNGSEAYARANASEELLDYWQEHGRMTLADYRASLLGGQLAGKAVAAWH